MAGLGAPSPQVIRAIDGGAAAVAPYRRGPRIEAVTVQSRRRLGWRGSNSAMSGHRALRLLLESDAKEPPCLVDALVGLWFRREMSSRWEAVAAILLAA